MTTKKLLRLIKELSQEPQKNLTLSKIKYTQNFFT